MKTNIIITLQVEGIHRWPQAAELFPEVKYLSDPHRHIFHLQVEKEVKHDDRDIEIIMLKREVLDFFKRIYWNENLKMCDFRSKSCEMIAKEVLETYDADRVSCLEDNENGAVVYKDELQNLYGYK